MNKTDWRAFSFDDIASNINERVMPLPEDKGKYVGLEHMDSGSLHITRWGSEAELIGEKLRMKKGDMLFARRNAYLKRVAIAPYDGIFSAHGMVLRPNTEVISTEFFPFFMLSDIFLDAAIKISVGSLSPTVNWGALRKLIFSVPPIDEQKRIAEVLWAADDVICQYDKVRKSLNDFKIALIRDFIINHLETEAYLGDVIEVCQYGLSSALSANGDYPVLRMMNLVDGKVVSHDLKYINLSFDELNKYKLIKNDILFNRTNSADLVGKTAIFSLDGDYVFASYLVRLRTNKDIILPEILNYILNLDEYQKKVRAFMSYGVSQANINASNLKKVKIPLFKMDAQKELLEKLNAVEKSIIDNIAVHEAAKALLSNQLNHYLGGAN